VAATEADLAAADTPALDPFSPFLVGDDAEFHDRLMERVALETPQDMERALNACERCQALLEDADGALPVAQRHLVREAFEDLRRATEAFYTAQTDAERVRAWHDAGRAADRLEALEHVIAGRPIPPPVRGHGLVAALRARRHGRVAIQQACLGARRRVGHVRSASAKRPGLRRRAGQSGRDGPGQADSDPEPRWRHRRALTVRPGRRPA
jgi:hypothetical protein